MILTYVLDQFKGGRSKHANADEYTLTRTFTAKHANSVKYAYTWIFTDGVDDSCSNLDADIYIHIDSKPDINRYFNDCSKHDSYSHTSSCW